MTRRSEDEAQTLQKSHMFRNCITSSFFCLIFLDSRYENHTSGSVSVTIVGERTNTKLFPLITLHDFGFDHESQFRSLERSGEDADKFFSQFVTYHIDLPGM